MNWGEALHSSVVVKEEPRTTRQKKTKGLENLGKLEKTRKNVEKNKGLYMF